MDVKTLNGVITVKEAGQVVMSADGQDPKPHRDPLDVEIEIIRRTLYNALDRLEKLRSGKRQRS